MTIKYYDLGREIMAYSGAVAPGIVECENGKYVRREDYETLEKALRDEIMTLTHKVITCGVAARHPDRNLSRTGAYVGKWDSTQAESVRKLRDKYEESLEALKALIDNLEMRSTWKEGRDKGVVDCCQGVYMQAKRALGDFK